MLLSAPRDLDELGQSLQAMHARCRTQLARLRAASGLAAGPSPKQHAREVLLLASSSRGGSTTTAEALRQCQRLLHFPAEINPYLHLHDLAWPTASPDDSLDEHHVTPQVARAIDDEWSWEAGRPLDTLEAAEAIPRLCLQLACRLSIQWPLEAFELDEVSGWARATLSELQATAGWGPAEFRSAAEFHVRFLRRARERHPQIQPWFYDLPRTLLEEHFPGLSRPSTAPGLLVLEEPPFVLVGPWQLATVEELTTQPLVIKTPSNAYRLRALRRLLPGARVRVLHLVRSGAASINGLIDGWLHHGFHSHRMLTPLVMPGYTDTAQPDRVHWWKFDLAPGWQGLTHQPLPVTCRHQWEAAHRAILADTAAMPASDVLRVRFEHIAGSSHDRHQAWEQIASWLGLDLNETLRPVIDQGLPQVMTTAQPAPNRWRAREGVIAPLLESPSLIELMEALGYGGDQRGW